MVWDVREFFQSGKAQIIIKRKRKSSFVGVGERERARKKERDKERQEKKDTQNKCRKKLCKRKDDNPQ
jgi:hypothetical protein